MILTITPPEKVQEQYNTIDASINKLDQISKEWNSVTNMLMRELFKKK